MPDAWCLRETTYRLGDWEGGWEAAFRRLGLALATVGRDGEGGEHACGWSGEHACGVWACGGWGTCMRGCGTCRHAEGREHAWKPKAPRPAAFPLPDDLSSAFSVLGASALVAIVTSEDSCFSNQRAAIILAQVVSRRAASVPEEPTASNGKWRLRVQRCRR